MSYITDYLSDIIRIATELDTRTIDQMAECLLKLRSQGGRLFIIGNGGSAANASHAVNDFRKIAKIEAYSPTDNVAELTAIANDLSWSLVFADWLSESHLSHRDIVFVLSVGGGSKDVSPNIVAAVDYAYVHGCGILGIVGRDGGRTAQVADACLIIPAITPETVTPYTESWQSVILHLLVNHPRLQ